MFVRLSACFLFLMNLVSAVGEIPVVHAPQQIEFPSRPPQAESFRTNVVTHERKVILLPGVDNDGGPLRYFIIEFPKYGQLSLEDSVAIYIAHTNPGADSFKYAVWNGFEVSPPATVFLQFPASPPLRLTPEMSGSIFSIPIREAAENGFTLQRSTDFRTWFDLFPSFSDVKAGTFTQPVSAGSREFFRLRK